MATPLKLSIEYDSTTDLYHAALGNGARFAFRRQDVGGRLENALDLYRRGVIAAQGERVALIKAKPTPEQAKREEREFVARMSAGKPVNRAGTVTPLVIDLDKLDIEP